MTRVRFSQILLTALVVLGLGAEGALAQVSITSPTNGVTAKLPSASDYATEVLGNPWDMDSISDLAEFIPDADYTNLADFSFANGFMTTSITAFGSWFHLLSPGQCGSNPLGKNGQALPIDTTKYRYLTVRMYTDQPSELRVLVNTGCSYQTDFWRSAGQPTRIGWHNYTIDLQSVTHEASSGQNVAWNAVPATGLRIEPSLVVGANLKFDWVTLSGDTPAETYTINYTATPSGSDSRHSLFLDDDTNPFNGYVKELVVGATSATPIQVTSGETFPGNYKVVGYLSNDFASLEGNPWDLSDVTDIFGPQELSTNFSNGTLSGVTTGGTPLVSFNNFGTSWDAATFRYLSFELNLSQGGISAVDWFDTNGAVKGSHYFASFAGNNVYQFDMQGLTGWTGNIGRLRMLVSTTTGTTYALNWVALRAGNSTAVEPNPTVVASTGVLNINSVPNFKILQPDNKGGEDFAAAVLGNPWNMDDANDIKSLHNLSDEQILPNNNVGLVQGDFFTALSRNGNGDPYAPNLETTNSTQFINASRYKNLVYKLILGRAQDVTNGSVVRVIWQESAQAVGSFFNGDDIITFDGWNEYVQDLTTSKLEELIHPPGSFPTPAWSGLIKYFRIDPHEFETPTSFFFDYIRITADDESNTKFAVTYELSDSDNTDAELNLSLFYNTSKSTSGATQIAANIPLSTSKSYSWDTTAIPNGTYYLYGVVSDGYNSITRFASGRLVVDHGRAQDSTVPVLSLDKPIEGQTIYDTFTVRGYALDNIQTASVEVLIDGALVGTVVPSLYNEAAHSSFSQFAEGSNAGFFKTLDISQVTTGSHALLVRAIDTAGNVTEINRTVNKVPGADPAPESLPGPTDAPGISIGTPLPTLSLSAKLAISTKTVTFTVKGGATCTTVGVVGATTAAGLAAGTTLSPIKAKSGAATVKFVGKKLKSLKKSKVKSKGRTRAKKPKDVTLYFAATCNGEVASSARKIVPTKLPGSTLATPAKWFSHLIGKLK